MTHKHDYEGWGGLGFFLIIAFILLWPTLMYSPHTPRPRHKTVVQEVTSGDSGKKTTTTTKTTTTHWLKV